MLQLIVHKYKRSEEIFGGDQNHLKKKKYKKANGCLRRPYKQLRKNRGAKGNGEKERYTRLNAEFQRIARRDKKAFFK